MRPFRAVVRMNEYIYNRFANQSKRSKFFSENQTYLDYFWQPAANLSENTPTLVYFLGYDGKIPQNPNAQEGWNILWVSDCNGPKDSGLWYFGTDGEDYLLQSSEQLINELLMCGLIDKKALFFSGKGMGGHAAVYFSIIFDGTGCYAHNPTTNLIDSSYVRTKHKSLFNDIFGDHDTHQYRKIEQLLDIFHSTSNILISFDISTENSFYVEQILPLNGKPVEIIKTSEYNFDSIFSRFEMNSPQPSMLETTNYQLQDLNAGLKSPVIIKLSSRNEVRIDNNFSFEFDPYFDRSWRFWFQNLSWLGNHLRDLDPKIREEQSTHILVKWFEFLQNENVDQEFFYHDHSLAYRAMNLLECLPFTSKQMSLIVIEHIRDIGQLLLSPLEDNALSNHAFDQAVSLFLVSDFFSSESLFKTWQNVALFRIKRELEYSFTFDGVHVENSPSYHHGMITNIYNSLTKILKITEHHSIRDHLDNLSKSVPYLAWIIRPDGKVPPIGDSEEKQVSTSLAKQISNHIFDEEIEGMQVFGDGYSIWKSTQHQYHLSLKSCHHGRFHRHDDDCSLTLWVKGLNLLMDSGLLYYLEKDPDRIHVRSAKGHSGFEIPTKKANRNYFSKSARRAKVEQIDSNTSLATLGMYGNFKASRSISLNEKIITINDIFSNGCISSGIIVNFVIDGIWSLEQTKKGLKFTNAEGKEWLLDYTGYSHDFKFEETFTSPLKNTKRMASRLSLTPVQNEVEIHINFGGV